MPRFFIRSEDIDGDTTRVEGNEFRHLQRVLRLRPGDPIRLFDDTGAEHSATITAMSPRAAAVRITATTRPERESPLAITLYQGIPKGQKLDLVVEKATELGVARIIPFTSTYSTSIALGTTKRNDRWQRLALAAAQQSGRTTIPSVERPQTFERALVSVVEHDLRLFFYEGRDAVALSTVRTPKPRPTTAAVIVGPEGGMSHDESLAAREAGCHVIGLGPRILRTETAGLVAVALVQARFGDLDQV